MVAQFLAHKPYNFASLTDSLILLFLKLLKICSWMQTRQTKNCFPGPKTYRDFREMGPRSVHSPQFSQVSTPLTEKVSNAYSLTVRSNS